jgi:hypothetical protein
VADHPKFTAALEKDQTALGDRILEVLYSPADERAILALEDNAAQSLLDIIQHVCLFSTSMLFSAADYFSRHWTMPFSLRATQRPRHGG